MISAGSAPGVGYYCGGGGGNDVRDASGRNYYTGAVEHGERPGQWSGRLADALGLTGDVVERDMEDVYERFVTPDGQPIGNGPRNYKSVADRVADALAKEPDALPERVEEIRSEVERSAQGNCRGMDLTFSVPKSVTVAYVAAWRAEQSAIRDGQSERADGYGAIRSAIDEAILEANRTALDVATGLATTRTGWHGSGHAGQWVATPDLVVASFPQLTSRADDPQFHIHNVVLNRGRAEDGRIGALDTIDLRQQKHAYSAVADRVLAERLGDLGIRMAMRPDGVSREIVGIDQSALDTFSQRRAQITKAMAPRMREREEQLGRPMNKLEKAQLAQQINLATREAKGKGDVDWKEMLDKWQDRITDEIGTGLGPIAEHLRAMVERGADPRASSFSPDAVIARAIQACADENASWNRADLILKLDMQLPDQMGLTSSQSVELLERLADQALASDGVVQVGGKVGAAPPKDLVPGSWVRPSDATYAAPVTLEAENLILRAAVERGRGPTAGLGVKAQAAWRDDVSTWLDQHYPTIQPDQRAAVIGLATTDAAMAQLVGPAGTGKSFTLGALSGVWSEMTGGRVIGLAVSQVATEVLKGDGVALSYNVAAWNAMQGRIASGNLRGDEITLGPNDILAVDETSMLGSQDAARIEGTAKAAGARVIPTGDPRQLGSPEAGGVMGLLSGRAETYTLTDVRRFSEEWEGKASLALRDGDASSLREYDTHGRLVAVDTMDQAMEQAARAVAADRLAGLTVSVTADTNEDAYRIADLVREQLVTVGAVEEDGIILVRSEQVAGLGDQVTTRQIDYALGVLNGSRFDVVGTGDDGSLSVVGEDGQVRELPASYVAAHVHLGYASTVHGSQGRTVDRGYTVTGGRTDSSALYVGMTRGRDRNTAFVALEQDAPAQGRLDAGKVKVEAPEAKPSAVSVLTGALERETQSMAALSEQEADARRLASMDTVLDRIEEITHGACRARLEGDLDRLVEDGVLPEQDRAGLAADQSTDHLSRVCRAAEQVGLDAQQVLREAIEDRPLDGLRSLAQGIAGRITSEHDLAASQPAPYAMPARLPAEHEEYLGVLHGQAQDRARELGSQMAVELPAWAVTALGPLPEDALARVEWETRAGAVAAYREAKGTQDSERTLTPMPGLSQTEARAAWNQAFDALGRPQETRVEAALSDGALHARVAAWEREQAWAPAHANASLREASLDADEARREGILARAAGDDEAAERWEQTATSRQAVADTMAKVADARGAWVEETAVTQDLAERAAVELRGRGIDPGQEPDRVTAEEWLEHQREVDARDEAVKDVTELDVPLVEDSTVVDTAERDEEAEVTGDSGESLGSDHSPEQSVHDESAGVEPARDVSEDGPVAGGGAPVEADAREPDEAKGWADLPESAGNVEPEAASPPDDTADTTPGKAEAAGDEGPEPEPEPEPARAPSHDVAPIHPDHAELAALVATEEAAQERLADRESEQAVHDAWEAEETAAPAEEAVEAADDVAELAGV